MSLALAAGAVDPGGERDGFCLQRKLSQRSLPLLKDWQNERIGGITKLVW